MKPDGGWGWVVVFSSFVIHVLIDGIKYSFGIMFIELMESFGENKSKTSWVMSIQIGVMLLSGPIIATMVNKIGCKSTVFLGTIVSCGGFIASAFVTSVYELYIAFGFCAGIGFGMMNLPSLVMLVEYFDSRLAFATGFANMGTGIGALIFNPLSKILIDAYTWRGTMFIEAGIILNGIVCAMVFKQLNNSSSKTIISNADKKDGEDKELINHGQQNVNKHIFNSDSTPGQLRSEKDSTNMFQDLLSKHHQSCDTRNNSNIQYEEEANNCVVDAKDCDEAFVLCQEQNENREKYEPKKSIVSHLTSPTSSFDESDNNHTLVAQDTSRRTSKPWINLKPFQNPGFITFLFGNFLLDLSLNIPITFIPDMMHQKGFKIQQAVWTIFLIGIVSTICRLGVGIIADIPVINRVKFCNSLIVLSGCVVIFGPFCYSFPTFLAFAVFYGIFSGSSNSLRGVLIPDLFGSEEIAEHLGITMFSSGLAAMISLPISGAMYDVTGSYRLPFIIAGAELIASGTFMFLIPAVQNSFNSRTVE
ncbi:monocarboxylate transporter 14-like [Ruditapes philippinarum]|uniref:monocarboxylate transporter 14-like n=1 Tax=Ruditapes philippinarum TaxID=129788 RepID=UPI00295A80A7|nr:monocarboxylate transporter 14-like [Ruditapes philippinarum]